MQDELDDTQSEVIEAERQREETERQREEAERQREEAERQREENRARYIRWVAGAFVGAAAIALLFWVVSRRSVASANRKLVRAERLAEAAQADLAERNAQDRLAGAVPGVFLDGADAAGHPASLRVPASVIASAGGAVVGRSPFDSTVVLDHGEVSRRHFRLFARGASVLVEDLDSTNGTTLNDVALQPRSGVPLHDGAVLQVGSLTFTVTLQT